MAEQYRGWVPILHYARGEYQRIGGSFHGALIEFEKALEIAEIGRHISWAYIATSQLLTLLEMGRYDEVRQSAEQRLDASKKANLGYMGNYFRIVLALAEAKSVRAMISI